jgi:hypothetical protein
MHVFAGNVGDRKVTETDHVHSEDCVKSPMLQSGGKLRYKDAGDTNRIGKPEVHQVCWALTGYASVDDVDLSNRDEA